MGLYIFKLLHFLTIGPILSLLLCLFLKKLFLFLLLFWLFTFFFECLHLELYWLRSFLPIYLFSFLLRLNSAHFSLLASHKVIDNSLFVTSFHNWTLILNCIQNILHAISHFFSYRLIFDACLSYSQLYTKREVDVWFELSLYLWRRRQRIYILFISSCRYWSFWGQVTFGIFFHLLAQVLKENRLSKEDLRFNCQRLNEVETKWWMLEEDRVKDLKHFNIRTLYALLKHWMEIILIFKCGLFCSFVSFGQDIFRIFSKSPVKLSYHFCLLKISFLWVVKDLYTSWLLLGNLFELLDEKQ